MGQPFPGASTIYHTVPGEYYEWTVKARESLTENIGTFTSVEDLEHELSSLEGGAPYSYPDGGIGAGPSGTPNMSNEQFHNWSLLDDNEKNHIIKQFEKDLEKAKKDPNYDGSGITIKNPNYKLLDANETEKNRAEKILIEERIKEKGEKNLGDYMDSIDSDDFKDAKIKIGSSIHLKKILKEAKVKTAEISNKIKIIDPLQEKFDEYRTSFADVAE